MRDVAQLFINTSLHTRRMTRCVGRVLHRFSIRNNHECREFSVIRNAIEWFCGAETAAADFFFFQSFRVNLVVLLF
jgi:hypothetical protein